MCPQIGFSCTSWLTFQKRMKGPVIGPVSTDPTGPFLFLQRSCRTVLVFLVAVERTWSAELCVNYFSYKNRDIVVVGALDKRVFLFNPQRFWIYPPVIFPFPFVQGDVHVHA
jgi:hypothetical protein